MPKITKYILLTVKVRILELKSQKIEIDSASSCYLLSYILACWSVGGVQE